MKPPPSSAPTCPLCRSGRMMVTQWGTECHCCGWEVRRNRAATKIAHQGPKPIVSATRRDCRP
jgi:hypothetical protein